MQYLDWNGYCEDAMSVGEPYAKGVIGQKENDMTQSNLIRNGSFDSLAGWVAKGNVKAGTLNGETAAVFNSSDSSLYQSVEGLAKGKYMLRARANHDGGMGHNAHVSVTWWDGGNPNIGGGTSIRLDQNSQEWKEVALPFEFSLDNSKIQLTLLPNVDGSGNPVDGKGTVYFTGLELTKTS